MPQTQPKMRQGTNKLHCCGKNTQNRAYWPPLYRSDRTKQCNLLLTHTTTTTPSDAAPQVLPVVGIVQPQVCYGYLLWKAFVCVGGAHCGRECNHYMYVVLFCPQHEQQFHPHPPIPKSSTRPSHQHRAVVSGLQGGSQRTSPVDYIDRITGGRSPAATGISIGEPRDEKPGQRQWTGKKRRDSWTKCFSI